MGVFAVDGGRLEARRTAYTDGDTALVHELRKSTARVVVLGGVNERPHVPTCLRPRARVADASSTRTGCCAGTRSARSPWGAAT